MGLDAPGLRHLIYCRRYGDYGQTLTIGRQQLLLKPEALWHRLGTKKTYLGYCEDLLRDEFGASRVDSIDYSAYEGSTLVYDPGEEIKNPPGQYDTVIDYGTLEHIFNINTALLNISKLCKVGGQIIHLLPANQQCGHGFWQMSPELFFSLYTEANGYESTEVFFYNCLDENDCRKLTRPEPGQRLLLKDIQPMYVAVRTILKRADFSHRNVYQSDYVHTWGTVRKPGK